MATSRLTRLAYWGLALMVILLVGCSSGPAVVVSEIAYRDYFPTKPGTAWLYRIEAKNDFVLRYREVYWLSDKDVSCAQFKDSIKGFSPENKTFQLELRVKGTMDRARFSIYDPEFSSEKITNAVELEVVKDELGIYAGTKNLFWITYPTSYNQRTISATDEVAIFDPHRYSGDLKLIGDGFSRRPIFFDAGIGLSFSERVFCTTNQSLEFVGPATTSQTNGIPNLHFSRTITGIETNGKKQSLTEDMIFAPGRGLIDLTQSFADGQTLMHWTLIQVPGQ